jgi:uncharacterized protein (DUF488 family)
VNSAPLFTIGHSTRSWEAFVALLKEAGVATLVDVRTVPRSRRNPQFGTEAMAENLPRDGISYLHMGALGGLRKKQPGIDPTLNGAWTNLSFHNYADYALSPAFHSALSELRALAQKTPTTICCAEAHWSTCHRRIISDHLLAAGEDVRHILAPGRIEPAVLNPWARVARDGTVTYPGGYQANLFQA